MALAENLEVTVGGDVNDGHLLLGGGLWRGPASAKNDNAESKGCSAAVEKEQQKKADASGAKNMHKMQAPQDQKK